MTIHLAPGGAVVVSPIAALAQQNDRIKRIGILPGTTTEHDPESEACLDWRHHLQKVARRRRS